MPEAAFGPDADGDAAAMDAEDIEGEDMVGEDMVGEDIGGAFASVRALRTPPSKRLAIASARSIIKAKSSRKD